MGRPVSKLTGLVVDQVEKMLKVGLQQKQIAQLLAINTAAVSAVKIVLEHKGYLRAAEKSKANGKQ